jgi:hypothetical protein
MTTSPGHPPQPAPRDHNHEQARQYLTAMAGIIAVEGIPCRITRDGGTLILIAEVAGGTPNPITVVIDPGNGPGFWVDCSCTWTTPAGTTPGTAADTVIAVLNAIRPGPSPAPQRM